MAYLPYAPQIGCKYVLTAPSGARAVFNDPLDADYVGVTYEVTGLDSAEVRENAQDLVESDGGAHGAFYFGRRPITMSARVFGFSTDVARDARIDKLRVALKECLRADGVLSWQNNPTGSNPPMQTWVRMQQPMRQTGAWVKELQVAMVSQYAPLFGSTLNTSASTASGVGRVLENKGDYPSYPLIRITGTSVNPTVAKTGGGTLSLSSTGLTIAAGETLEIDTLNHTANFIAGARNGQNGNSFINFATTVWPTLTKGNSTLTLSGGGSMVVVYRDAWS